MPEPNPASLIPFTFDGAPVRALLVDGEPHFVGRDVAERLGYSNATDAMNTHCKGVAKRYPLQTAGGMQNVRILAEPDVLRLIVGSKLPAAERFERWVFEEVLPTIRKTGAYTAPGANPYSPDKIAAVREARLTFGRAAAQKVWHAAGLPPVSPLPEEPRQSSMFDPPAAPAKSQGRYAPGSPQGEEFRTLMAMRPGDEVVLPSRPPHTRFSATLTRARKQSPFLLSSRREGDAIRVSCSAPTRQH